MMAGVSSIRRSARSSRIALYVSPLYSSRKANKFRIPRHPIRRNALPPKPLLHNNPSRLIKPDIPLLHHPQHFLLPRIVQSGPLIATNNVIGDVEVRAVEASFDVAAEGGWDRRVAVEVEGSETQVWTGEARDGLAGLGKPAGAGEVKDCGCQCGSGGGAPTVKATLRAASRLFAMFINVYSVKKVKN